MPIPEYIGITPAGMNDNKAFEQIAPTLLGDDVYADKAYSDHFKEHLMQFNLLTPIKKEKGQAYLTAAVQWLSTAASRVRQPIESFFNWLEEKTSIQIASNSQILQRINSTCFSKNCGCFIINYAAQLLMGIKDAHAAGYATCVT